MPPSRGRMALASATRRLMGRAQTKGSTMRMIRVRPGPGGNDLLDAEGTGRYQAEEHERNAKSADLALAEVADRPVRRSRRKKVFAARRERIFGRQAQTTPIVV